MVVARNDLCIPPTSACDNISRGGAAALGRQTPKGIPPMRRLALVTVMALTLLGSASNALATGPERVADGPPPAFTDATCGFPLSVEVVANREVAKTWFDASGAP